MRARVAWFVAFGLILTASSSYAQLEIGVRGGFRSATISNLGEELDDDEDATVTVGRRNGFEGGVYFRRAFTEMLSIQPAVLFAQGGATAEQNFEEVLGVEGTFKFDYIAVPIPVRIDFGPSGGVRPFVLVGPYFAINTSAKQKLEFDISQELIDEFGGDLEALNQTFLETFGVGSEGGETDFGDDIKKVDFGVVIGGGVTLTNRLAVGADFSLGLTNVGEDDDSDIKNRAFSVFVMVNLTGN